MSLEIQIGEGVDEEAQGYTLRSGQVSDVEKNENI